jgi:adenine-specific DNA-methyltransferase
MPRPFKPRNKYGRQASEPGAEPSRDRSPEHSARSFHEHADIHRSLPGGEPVRPQASRQGAALGAGTGSGAVRPQRLGPGLRKPTLTRQVTTLWDYPSQHYGNEEQGSQKYKGATPSYVIWNVLELYTEPNHVVLDPFCGSGTTLDVCRDAGRQGLGFDLHATRPDIQIADARSLPVKAGSVDLVFMDPPYADNLAYSEDARCIGKLKGDGRYQRAMRLVIDESHRVLRQNGVLAIYVCDVFKKDRHFWPLGFELFELARQKLAPLDMVAVTRHNRTLEQGNYRKAADEGRFLLRGFNHLMFFRKLA